MTNEELEQLERDVGNGNNGNGLGQGRGSVASANAGGADDGNHLSVPGVGMSATMGSKLGGKSLAGMSSAGKSAQGSSHGKRKASNSPQKGNRGGHSPHRIPEREPCQRCIENAKKKRKTALQLKRAQQKGQYMPLNFDELEAQLRQGEGHDCDEFILNKMHPGDINFRDKRMTKMLGIFQEDLAAATSQQ